MASFCWKKFFLFFTFENLSICSMVFPVSFIISLHFLFWISVFCPLKCTISCDWIQSVSKGNSFDSLSCFWWFPLFRQLNIIEALWRDFSPKNLEINCSPFTRAAATLQLERPFFVLVSTVLGALSKITCFLYLSSVTPLFSFFLLFLLLNGLLLLFPFLSKIF